MGAAESHDDGLAIIGSENSTLIRSNLEIESELWDYLCRVGTHGHVGRFRASNASEPFDRNDWVVCRSARGLEAAEVLSQVPRVVVQEVDGQVLRRMTPEDTLLWTQLRDLSRQAYEECQRWLEKEGRSDVLLEVEPLLDGKTLYFHFLGQPTDDTNSMVERLANHYQEQVAESRFAKLLEHGCGPGCGTDEKKGCGSGGGCAVCTVASACKKK